MQFWIQFWILLRYFQTCLHNLKLWFWPVVFFERISKFYRFGRSANFVSLLHTSSRTQRGIISLSVRSQNKVRRCWLLQPFLDLSVVICHPILDVAANKVIPDFQKQLRNSCRRIARHDRNSLHRESSWWCCGCPVPVPCWGFFPKDLRSRWTLLRQRLRHVPSRYCATAAT